MKDLLPNLKFQFSEKFYVKDPETTTLGRRIIQESILLIDELGFDDFTFKKLGERIGSNESSLYRYFENKHKLLVYLSAWYWSWMEYRLLLATTNIDDPRERLKRAIITVSEKIEDDNTTIYVNESVLNRIIIAEFSKTFLTKEVDDENREGYFIIYKRIIGRIADHIKDVNADYPYAESLASTVIQGALHQHFLKDHFSTITNCNVTVTPADFYLHLVTGIVNNK